MISIIGFHQHPQSGRDIAYAIDVSAMQNGAYQWLGRIELPGCQVQEYLVGSTEPLSGYGAAGRAIVGAVAAYIEQVDVSAMLGFVARQLQ